MSRVSTEDRLKAARLALRTKRNHQSCAIHGRVRRVCQKCEHVYCPRCKIHPCLRPDDVPQPRTRTRTSKAQFTVPALLQPIWAAMEPLNPIRIEPSPDIEGGWRLVFLPDPRDGATLESLFWSQPTIKTLVASTPFGVTKTQRHWYLTVTLI